ncbi:hypothetical protein LSCM1_03646 [Leishmania martiniquensis]|uniref:Uncharacterized protein n=1 Tax=Leishmania martiniquensis TaxID=1580590 RepID=A0A836GQS3_9TRYP|nr:hypothetical protein LSCM1_03646 [Leishmania martiniquensis]
MTSPRSAKRTRYLSVAGWVAGYLGREQWVLASPPLPASSVPQPHALPLHYDYVPGMMARLSSARSPASPLEEALRKAEAMWQSQAEAAVAQQSQEVAALTDVRLLGLYTASFPAVTAKVSGKLSDLSVRQPKGLDGVCRSGYGCTATAGSTSAPCVCPTCTSGPYAVLNATSERNTCACVPQRTLGEVASAAGQRVRACLRLPGGPAAPRLHLRPPGLLFIDAEGPVGDGIPLGWYGSGSGSAGTGLPATTSLEGWVTCTYGLTVPRLVTASSSVPPNFSAALQYTTGLGAEECGVMAAARGGHTTRATQPTYSPLSSYGLRLRAPSLPSRTISLANNSRLSTDQTVLTVGVQDYALLPHYAVNSLLHMRGIDECHAAFLIYMLRCATVSAALRCGSPPRDVANFTWAGSSSLDSSVLRVNLTGMVTEECQVSFTVRSAFSAASEASVPHTSWPYTHLATDADSSHFFEASPTLHYTLLPSAAALTIAALRYDPLSEGSRLIISFALTVLSLSVVIIFISFHPPSLHPFSWRHYERARARRHCQRRQPCSASVLERLAE